MKLGIPLRNERLSLGGWAQWHPFMAHGIGPTESQGSQGWKGHYWNRQKEKTLLTFNMPCLPYFSSGIRWIFETNQMVCRIAVHKGNQLLKKKLAFKTSPTWLNHSHTISTPKVCVETFARVLWMSCKTDWSCSWKQWSRRKTVKSTQGSANFNHVHKYLCKPQYSSEFFPPKMMLR